MAIYHFSAKLIKRSDGRSSVAASAYRSASIARDERTGVIHDYTGKRDVLHSEIFLPKSAKAWASNRSKLWNEVERAERRSDAQTAREFEIALPRELPQEERQKLVLDWVKSEFVDKGYVADVAFHRGHGIDQFENPHAHVLIPTRSLTPDGSFAKKKDRSLNTTETLEHWRESWEMAANRTLERNGIEERVDRRSLADQGIDREPTVHLGPAVAAMERRGIETDRGDMNRLITEFSVLRDYEREIERMAEMETAWDALEERASENTYQRLSHMGTYGPFGPYPRPGYTASLSMDDDGATKGTIRRIERDDEHGIALLIVRNDDREVWKPYHYQGLRVDRETADEFKDFERIGSGSKKQIIWELKSEDPYDVLGVDEDATSDEIKSAYRKLAREVHPDVAEDQDDAEVRMRNLNIAYDLLRDPIKRRQYARAAKTIDVERDPEGVERDLERARQSREWSPFDAQPWSRNADSTDPYAPFMKLRNDDYHENSPFARDREAREEREERERQAAWWGVDRDD